MSDEKLSDAAEALLLAVQIDACKAFHEILRKHGEANAVTEVSYNQLAYSFGSAIASALYEELRAPEQREATPEQSQYLTVCGSSLNEGFSHKLEILTDPQSFEEAVAIGELSDDKPTLQ